MADRITAREQFERITDLLPRVARAGRMPLGELAAVCRISERQLHRDLHEVLTRAFYHPAGGSEDIQISLDDEGVEVWTAGEFRRPPRLLPREALALGLGFRTLAAEAPAARREHLLALARRLENELAAAPAEMLLPRYAVEDGDGAGEGVRAFLNEAARGRRRALIHYLKPGADAPDERTVRPYVLAHAEGGWYLLGYCETRTEVRVFRLDRILSASPAEGTFEPPADFDPASFISNGRIYRGGDEIEVTIRYTANIARWIQEQEAVGREADGSVVRRYRVADPRWIVRHVLSYGADAEVLEPEAVSRMVAEAAARIAADHPAPESPGAE
jgi:proteasome accessory factor C